MEEYHNINNSNSNCTRPSNIIAAMAPSKEGPTCSTKKEQHNKNTRKVSSTPCFTRKSKPKMDYLPKPKGSGAWFQGLDKCQKIPGPSSAETVV